MPGHEAQILGDAMEDACCNLLTGLGYTIVDRKYPKPSLDIIADFKKPRSASNVILQRPAFSPRGRTAFSIKEGTVRRKDIRDLKDAFRQARRTHNQKLRTIEGCVLVTNEPRTKGQIDSLLRKEQVYCWDIRRLMFYATKVRSRVLFSHAGRVIEYMLPTVFQSSCLVHSERMTDENTLPVSCVIFVDDHSCFCGQEESLTLLADLYKAVLKPIVRSTTFRDVLAMVSLHVLGMVDTRLATNAFIQYARDNQAHPRVIFSPSPPFRVYSYAASPWSPIMEEQQRISGIF